MSTPEEKPSALYVGRLPHALLEQVLITIWPDGSAEMAFRDNEGAAWGPPHPLERR